MPLDSSWKSPTLGLSSVKFLLKIDGHSLSYGLYTACPQNWHIAILSVFYPNLELVSTVRLENFIVDCISVGKPMTKFSKL